MNAAGVHSMLRGWDSLEGGIVAWRTPFVPYLRFGEGDMQVQKCGNTARK